MIAAYAKAAGDAGGQVTIVSSDKDLMQLIRPGVEMLDPIKQKPIGPAEVMEKFGVTPDKMIDVQALIGDSVDNVPGVPGIGPKGAAQLINEFGDLDSVLAAAPAMKPSKRRDNLIEHAEKARMSRELVTLRDRHADAAAGRYAACAAIRQDEARRVAQAAGLPLDRDAARAWMARRRPPRRLKPRRAVPRRCCRCRKLNVRRWRSRVRDSDPMPRSPAEAALRDFLAETAHAASWRSIPRPTGWTRCAHRLVGLSFAVAAGRACLPAAGA